MRRPWQSGFSLIEVLVVIGIVAVLIGILLPALASARKTAKTTLCLTQSRDLVMSINAMGASNGGRLPENRTRVSENEHVTWRSRFLEDGFVTDPGAFICPLHPGEPSSELGFFDMQTRCVGDVPSSYAINGHLLWRSEVRDETEVRRDTAIQRPSHTILIAETRARFPDIRVTNQLIAADDDLGGFFGFWHAGDGVYAFQDGHAETINLIDTGSPDCRWHNGRDLDEDTFNPQEPGEIRSHDHPDWAYLAHPVYFSK